METNIILSEALFFLNLPRSWPPKRNCYSPLNNKSLL